MLGNVESTIYAFSTNKWPQMWPPKQIEWATGNPLLDSTRDNLIPVIQSLQKSGVELYSTCRQQQFLVFNQ
jgi:hypothetical protein